MIEWIKEVITQEGFLLGFTLGAACIAWAKVLYLRYQTEKSFKALRSLLTDIQYKEYYRNGGVL